MKAVAWVMPLMLVSAIVVISSPPAAASVPSCGSGSSQLVSKTYYPVPTSSADIIRATLTVCRGTTDGSGTYDYYGVANTIRQWQTDFLYDHMNWWNSMWEDPDGLCPDQTDEEPGNLNTEDGAIGFSLTVAGVSLNFEIPWTHNQGGSFEIVNGHTGCYENTEGWDYAKHHEYFNLAGNRGRDWNDMSFATAYSVKQDESHWVKVRSAVKFGENDFCGWLCASWEDTGTKATEMPMSGNDCGQGDSLCNNQDLTGFEPLGLITDDCREDSALVLCV